MLNSNKRGYGMIGVCPNCGKLHYGVLKNHTIIITPGDDNEDYDTNSKEQQTINMEDFVILDGRSDFSFATNCTKCNEFDAEIQWFDPEIYKEGMDYMMALTFHNLAVNLAGFGTGGSVINIDKFFTNGILNITAYGRAGTKAVLDGINSTINPLIHIKESPTITIKPNLINYKFDIDFGDLDDKYIMNWLKRFVDTLHKNLLDYKEKNK